MLKIWDKKRDKYLKFWFYLTRIVLKMYLEYDFLENKIDR